MFPVNLPQMIPQNIAPVEILELRSMPLQDNEQIRSTFNHLPKDLQQLFKTLFNNDNKVVSLKALLPFKERKTEINICNKVVSVKEISFRCFDCLLHEGSLICQKCFREGNHNSHRYSKVREEGSCDCGNESILKESGHCCNHLVKPENREVKIEFEDKFKFQLYIKQLFIWAFITWSKYDINTGIIFLLQLIKYLSELNKESMFYNILTTEVLFNGKLSLMSQLFQVCFAESALQKILTLKFIDLLLIMYPCQEFKEQLLVLMIQIYNKIDWFESSKFQKVLIVLLSDPKTVERVMSKAKNTLNPSQRRYNPVFYYKHLLMAELLKPQIGELLLHPLITNETVQSLFLHRIQAQCETGNGQLLSIITEHTEEEYLYYRVLTMAIKMVTSKETLTKMARNYFKMLNSFSFKKNRIILIPHRVLGWLIFKYFDFDLRKIAFDQLCILFGEDQPTMKQFVYKYFRDMVGCLLEFSLDLVRNTYFYNYRFIYTTEESQVVTTDYLVIKILANLYSNSPKLGSFAQTLFENIYREDISDIESKNKEQKKDIFDKWTKILQILSEIVYSPKIEIVNCILLGEEERVEKQSIDLIARIGKKLGKIHVNIWQTIEKHFFFRKCKESWIGSVLIFDKESSKYQIKKELIEEKIQDINFDRYVSLTHSNLASLMKNQKGKLVVMNEEAKRYFNILLDSNMVNQFLIFQLDFGKNNFDLSQMFTVIPDMVRVSKNINLFSAKPLFEWFYQECQQIAMNLRLIYSQKYQSKMIDKSQALIKDLEKLIKGQEETSSELSKQFEEERKRKKVLLQVKKEKLMKERKMKENQQKYMEQNQEQVQKIKDQEGQEECLICKQKSAKSNLCYLAKARLNNILFEYHKFHEKHMMFFSCFHMVHFTCFKQQLQQKKVVPCPLCYSASNIVIPHESAFPKNNFLPAIYKQILKSFSNVYKKTYEGLYLQCFIYLAYASILSLDKPMINERQVQLYQSIFCLMVYQTAEHFSSKNDLIEEFILTNDFNIEKDPSNLLRRYIKIIYVFVEYAVRIRLSGDKDAFQELSSRTMHELRNFFSELFSEKILRYFMLIFSPLSSNEEKYTNFEAVKPAQRLLTFKGLPSTLLDLFKLRDSSKCNKSVSHTPVICILCGQKICLECQQIKKHTQKVHLTESLFFNLQNGGLKYCHLLQEITIQSMFINNIGILWNPESESKEFFLDEEILKKLLEALRAGNLFYYITHTYEGLKGKNIPDII